MSSITEREHQFVCEQEGCGVAAGGPCLEGFENPEDCPHVSLLAQVEPATEEAAPEEPDTPAQPAPPRRMGLYSGEPLTAAEALDITLSRRTQLVVLAGPADSGKTTLLTSLYEKFQEAPFAGFLFAGSRTLPAFERRCHLARLASRRTEPDTERTSPAEREALLHLRLEAVEDGTSHEVLLTDLPGEIFRLLRDSTEEAARFNLLRRADLVAVLLDGGRLADPDERQQAVSDTRLLLRSCLDAGVLDEEVHIDLVVSKLDLLEDGGNEAQAFAESAVEQVRGQIEGRVADVRVVHIAARPRIGSSFELAHGVDALLARWLQRYRSFGPRLLFDPRELAARESEMFLKRALPAERS